MPIIDVTHDDTVTDDQLDRLVAVLPDLVAEAVACPEEPWTGPPGVGDIEIRFHEKGPRDVGLLNCVVEVRTKRLASREEDEQERADLLCEAVRRQVELGAVGVWLILVDGAWSQATRG